MSVLTELWRSMHVILAAADWITLAMLVIVTVAAAFLTEGFATFVTSVFIALVVFAAAVFARAAIMGDSKGDITGLALSEWNTVMSWKIEMLLAYVIIFAVLIGLVSTIRRVVTR
ncbi:MAG: hypothetical protein WBQ17_02460 [Rhizomicrobium sp.]